MNDSILLATDLDRTALPNGAQPESEGARERFREFTSRPDVTLAYISGRGEQLLKDAITEYAIPLPAFAIGDVGTTVFITHDGSWKPLEKWQEEIRTDWKGHDWNAMRALFEDIDVLSLQEGDKQNTFKLSYYAPEHTDSKALIDTMRQRLAPKGIDAALIWSIDEAEHTGLLDVLPQSATKLHALQFLRKYLGFSEDRTVFCGDSGNDIPALTSGLNAVLVANARDEVKEEVQLNLREKGLEEKLYIAQGDFLGMNGNYSAGVLEGVAHFFPESVSRMAT